MEQMYMVVKDRGNRYEILDIFPSEEQSTVKFEGEDTINYKIYSHELYDHINKLLQRGRHEKAALFFPKGIGKVTENCLIYEADEVDEVEREKKNIKIAARDLFVRRVGINSVFDTYLFVIANNILCSRGFFLHEENREETYIEIINTGDQQLINALEDFLNLHDELKVYSVTYRHLTEFYKSLDDATSKEEVQEAYQDLKNSLADISMKQNY